MFDSILGNLQSVAILGSDNSDKTTLLVNLAERALLKGKNVCVIEPWRYEGIKEYMKIPQENETVTMYVPTNSPFPDKVTQIMFMQIPRFLNHVEVYNLPMLIKLLKYYDVFLIDEAVYTLNHFLKEDTIKEFVELLINDGKIIVIFLNNLEQLKGYSEFQVIYNMENPLVKGAKAQAYSVMGVNIDKSVEGNIDSRKKRVRKKNNKNNIDIDTDSNSNNDNDNNSKDKNIISSNGSDDFW